MRFPGDVMFVLVNSREYLVLFATSKPQRLTAIKAVETEYIDQ